MNVRLLLIRARPKFYIFSDNPRVSLGTVDCSLYARRIGLKKDYQRKRLDVLGYTPVKFNC